MIKYDRMKLFLQCTALSVDDIFVFTEMVQGKSVKKGMKIDLGLFF